MVDNYYYNSGGKIFVGCWKDTAWYKNKSKGIMIKCGEFYLGCIRFCGKCQDKFNKEIEK